MKTLSLNFLYAIIFVCLVSSCETDLFDENVPTVQRTDITTRANSDYSGYSPLSNLVGIQVNVVLLENGNKKYLSTSKKNNKIDLFDKDDGSARQRWYLTSNSMGQPGLQIVGGAYVTNGELGLNGFAPVLSPPGLQIIGRSFTEIPNQPSCYYIGETFMESFNPIKYKTMYLSSKSHGSSELIYKEKNQLGYGGAWQIIPVNKFELLDVEYFKDGRDIINSKIDYLVTFHMKNGQNPNKAIMTESIEESISETSTFSEVEGVKMTTKIANSGSVKVGIGKVVEFGGGLSIETTKEKAVTYTTTETVTLTKKITDTFTTEVDPYTDVAIDILVLKYDVNISYKAKLRDITTGKIITLYGKWSGKLVGKDVYYEPKVIRGSRTEPFKIEGKLHISDYKGN